MEILGVICFLIIALCLVNIIPHYAGKRIISKRIQAYRSLAVPVSFTIRNYDSARQIMFSLFAGIIALGCIFFYPHLVLPIVAVYVVFIALAYILTEKVKRANQQVIEINGNELRLVDWNGVVCPVEPGKIRYAHFYQNKTAKGWDELYPRVTLYCDRPEDRTAYAACRPSLVGAEHGLGHEGMEYINHLHITPKEYVLLLKYCLHHRIPVEDDYAAKMRLL